MLPKSIKSLVAVLFIILLLSACSDKNLGTPTGIVVQPAENAEINYGHRFKVETYMTYDSGKRKLLNSKKDIEFIVKGGEVKGEMISVPSYPTSFQPDTIYVTARYARKDLNFETNKAIPYNYKGNLEMRFNGESGEGGADGSDGNTPLLFRDGKDGDDGSDGGLGNPGHDLSIHVYKVEKTGLYHIRVMDVTTSKFYFFRYKDSGFPIKIYVEGGNGGVGGDGGDGGDGKDGKKTEKKEKDPGAGGNGGIGGNGGTGGTGGTVFLFVHPNANGVQKKFVVSNIGGSGGAGGKGGKAGKAGDPLEGQEQPSDGLPGAEGHEGLIGDPGQPVQISVEDFDIDF